MEALDLHRKRVPSRVAHAAQLPFDAQELVVLRGAVRSGGHWPPVAHATPLLQWLTTVPAALSSVALVLAADRDDQDVSLRCLLRVAAPVDELTRLSHGIEEGGRRAGATCSRSTVSRDPRRTPPPLPEVVQDDRSRRRAAAAPTRSGPAIRPRVPGHRPSAGPTRGRRSRR